jgi:uncharacterized protein (TIGR02145 family)
MLDSCKKATINTQSAIILYDSISDYEGNIYKTVKIGNQWWMAENLKSKKFRNGNYIRAAQDENQWKLPLPGYCKYDDKESGTGLLYNYYAIQDTSNLAPIGWHIPTDEDWKELEKYLGMNANQTDSISWRGKHVGNILKVKGYKGWIKYKDSWPTDSVGFSAMAGSCRLPDGRFGDPGLFYAGFWWTVSTFNDSVYYRHLDHKNENIFRFYANKGYGMSIRCVKDK